MDDEKSNVIPLADVVQKALPRMSDSYLASVGNVLKHVRDKASPKDQWVYHLYSGMVAERLKCNEQTVQIEANQLQYIEALSMVTERMWRLEDLIEQRFFGPHPFTPTNAQTELIFTCHDAAEKRSQPQENQNDPQKTH